MDLSVKISNYKCFGEEEQGFDRLTPITLIIGRNNTGKSTLLELVEYTVTQKIEFSEAQWHNKQRPQIILEAPLAEKEVQSVFGKKTSEGEIKGNHWNYEKVFVEKQIKWKLSYYHAGLLHCIRTSASMDRA